MEEEKKNLSEEKTEEKSAWQATKEGWYDKIPLSLKQLDFIIDFCFAALAVIFVLILLDVTDIYHIFG